MANQKNSAIISRFQTISHKNGEVDNTTGYSKRCWIKYADKIRKGHTSFSLQENHYLLICYTETLV